MRFPIRPRTILLMIFTLLLGLKSLQATVPMTLPLNKVWSDSLEAPGPNRLALPLKPLPPRDLANYIGQFELISHFLTTMQEHELEDDDFGGLHEGEGDQLWRIVETDNTQEAIRVWCEYALYFEDTDTYRDNIDAAWRYTDNFPAWEEAGQAEMYTIHNCGWGLVAEMRYRQAYDDSRREYGIRCADHLAEHTPEITVNMEDRLMPLAAGWAAGTLYNYGLFEENQEYLEAALRIGAEVKAWIDEDPDRLNRNEIWALCGGTAMWGVLQSIGKADSAETADWAVETLENMDVIAGNGQWNSSWNIWYAHAWIAANELVGANEYLGNAEFIVDSLLALDTDGDGGIPATIGDADNRDQSWVTAYTAWMGLTNLFEILPAVNVGMGELLSPALDRPWPVEFPLWLNFTVQNMGYLDVVECPIIILGDLEADTVITIDGWQPNIIELTQEWTPEEAGEYHFDIIAGHEEDGDMSNDTLSFDISILPQGWFRIWSRTVDGDPVGCHFYFYNIDIDPDMILGPEFELERLDGGMILGLAMIGNYSIFVVPEFPYARQWINNVVIVEAVDEVFEFDMAFIQPPVLLIDRDTNTFHSQYYTDALDSLGYTYYHLTDSDSINHEGFSTEFPTILYFTGDRDSMTVPEYMRDELAEHQQNGGALFITGQYIADELAEDDFLGEVLHSRHLIDDTNMMMVEGIESDEAFDGFQMLILGNRGANNQTSPSGIMAADGGAASALYRDRGDTAGVVRWELDNEARGMFFSFGFEAISGQAGNSRDEVMRAVLDWLETPVSVDQFDVVPLPTLIGIESVYPNPFNSSVTIFSHLSSSDGYYYQIYDMIGRRVVTLPISSLGLSYWNGTGAGNASVPNGNYFIVLQRHTDHRIFDTAKISLIK